jgi:hypothetical protein
LFQLFATGVIDTSGKFTAGVNDTAGNLPSVSLTPAVPMENLPTVHLDLQYFREFSKNFLLTLRLFSGA